MLFIYGCPENLRTHTQKWPIWKGPGCCPRPLADLVKENCVVPPEAEGCTGHVASTQLHMESPHCTSYQSKKSWRNTSSLLRKGVWKNAQSNMPYLFSKYASSVTSCTCGILWKRGILRCHHQTGKNVVLTMRHVVSWFDYFVLWLICSIHRLQSVWGPQKTVKPSRQHWHVSDSQSVKDTHLNQ